MLCWCWVYSADCLFGTKPDNSKPYNAVRPKRAIFKALSTTVLLNGGLWSAQHHQVASELSAAVAIRASSILLRSNIAPPDARLRTRNRFDSRAKSSYFFCCVCACECAYMNVHVHLRGQACMRPCVHSCPACGCARARTRGPVNVQTGPARSCCVLSPGSKLLVRLRRCCFLFESLSPCTASRFTWRFQGSRVCVRRECRVS